MESALSQQTQYELLSDLLAEMVLGFIANQRKADENEGECWGETNSLHVIEKEDNEYWEMYDYLLKNNCLTGWLEEQCLLNQISFELAFVS